MIKLPNYFYYANFLAVETNEKDPTNQGFSTDGLIEGDIAGVEVDSGGNISHNYVNSAEALWTGGIVPYVISDVFSKTKNHNQNHRK